MIKYEQNKIKKNNLKFFILKSDNEFTPSLSSRVNIDEYSAKIFECSKTFEAYVDENLVSIIAMYINNELTRCAYITYVYCDKEYRRCGITKKLLSLAIKYAKEKNYKKINLECQKDNISALNFYKNLGFKQICMNKNNNFYKMELNL